MTHRNNLITFLVTTLPIGALAVLLAGAQGGSGVNAAAPPWVMSQPQWVDKMHQMGMSDGMMMRCRMIAAAQVDAYDPASILAYQFGLDLSDDQVKQVQAIAEKAREQVKQVLTPDQVAQLQPMASGPQSMMQMHRQMQQMNQRDGKQWNAGMMMCPMYWPNATAQPSAGSAPQQPQQYPMMRCRMNCW